MKPTWQFVNETFHHLCFHNKLNHCTVGTSPEGTGAVQCVAQACKHGRLQNASRLGVEHGIVASIISIITVSISHLAVADLIWRLGYGAVLISMLTFSVECPPHKGPVQTAYHGTPRSLPGTSERH